MPILIDGEIVLYGLVGIPFDPWTGDEGYTALDVIQALAQIGRGNPVTVRLNSQGGIATEGTAIYAQLAAHRGDVTVVIEGMAASAASVIAMAGKTRSMRKGAVMMIHEPSGLTFGTPGDHQKSLNALNVLGDSLASIYAERTGRTVAEERQVMVDETWMTAEDAVARGYADAADEPGEALPPPAFNYAAYRHAPAPLVAMATAKGWSRPVAMIEPKPRAAAEDWQVGASRDLAIDDKTAWDGAAAEARMFADAGFDGDNPDPVKARRGFLAYDAGNPKLRGSYKEPFADLIGGELKAIKGGIDAAASRLPQSDLPQAVKDEARKVLDDYEAKMKPPKQESAMTEVEIKAATDKAVADAIAAHTAAEKTRQTEIKDLCALAGFGSKAGEFIASGKTVPEARSELVTLKAANPGGEINPRHRGPTAQTGAENAQQAAQLAKDLDPTLIYAARRKAREGRQPGMVTV